MAPGTGRPDFVSRWRMAPRPGLSPFAVFPSQGHTGVVTVTCCQTLFPLLLDRLALAPRSEPEHPGFSPSGLGPGCERPGVGVRGGEGEGAGPPSGVT